MKTLIYPPVNPFATPDNHPNWQAHKWLDDQLDSLDWKSEVDHWWIDRQSKSLLAQLSELPPTFQIAVLQACLERMSWHQQQRSIEDGLSAHYYIGSLLYTMVGILYRRKLPYSEVDICHILRLSRHSCGHGNDVTPPFNMAVRYACDQDITPELLSALKEFTNGLKGVRSAQVSHLKRRASLLFVLEEKSKKSRSSCWSDRFRAGLQMQTFEEQAKWQRLVLGMAINDVYLPPKTWYQEATKFIQDLSPPVVVQRLSAWWPDPIVSIVWPIETGGSHLLKYFVWLLSITATMGELETECTELICRLSKLDWKPRAKAQKVMIAVAYHLRSYSPQVSWPALQRLAHWSSLSSSNTTGTKIDEVLRIYCQSYKLEIPEFESRRETEKTND